MIGKNIAFFVVVILQTVLISVRAPLIYFAWLKVLESAIGGFSLLVLYNKFTSYSILCWQWSFQVAKMVLKENWYLILAAASTVIYMKIDQVMLGEMVGDKAVGIYSAASRISEVWYFIPMAVCSSCSPAIFRAKEISQKLFCRRLEQLIRCLIFLSLLIVLPMIFCSSSLITILFGSDYAQSGQILSIHIFNSIFVFMGIGSLPWFTAEKCNHILLAITATGAITNIILNCALIPKYGGIGAAFATLISQFLSAFLSNLFYRDTRQLFYIQLNSLLFFKR